MNSLVRIPHPLHHGGNVFATLPIKTTAMVAILAVAALGQALALISVGNISKDRAEKMGNTMKFHSNGDAGVKVWPEFLKQGELEGFTYAELRMEDAEGNQLNPLLWHVSKGKLEVTWSGSGSLKQPQFYQDATGGSRLESAWS